MANKLWKFKWRNPVWDQVESLTSWGPTRIVAAQNLQHYLQGRYGRDSYRTLRFVREIKLYRVG